MLQFISVNFINAGLIVKTNYRCQTIDSVQSKTSKIEPRNFAGRKFGKAKVEKVFSRKS